MWPGTAIKLASADFVSSVDEGDATVRRIIQPRPNAPAWGSLDWFRFLLPEDVNVDRASLDMSGEPLFQGPPSVLQIFVYKKKFMSDQWLGSADVKLNAVGIWYQL